MVLALLLAALASVAAAAEPRQIRFVRAGRRSRRPEPRQAGRGLQARDGRPRRPVLRRAQDAIAPARSPTCCASASASRSPTLDGRDFFLRARDGYAKPVAGERCSRAGRLPRVRRRRAREGRRPRLGADRPQAGRSRTVLRRVDGRGAAATRTAIRGRISSPRSRSPRSTSVYPHIAPQRRRDGSPAYAGYAIFRSSASPATRSTARAARVGPELNVPRSIVEYRPGRSDQGLHPRSRQPSATRACRRIRSSPMPTARRADRVLHRDEGSLKHDPRAGAVSVAPPRLRHAARIARQPRRSTLVHGRFTAHELPRSRHARSRVLALASRRRRGAARRCWRASIRRA